MEALGSLTSRDLIFYELGKKTGMDMGLTSFIPPNEQE
jgi:hypothetical protein